MNPEKYSLSWHTYYDHLREMMKEMIMNNDFADVTLVSEDKKHIRAHKNVLSACSPVFKDIVKLEQSAKPIIYLRGINFSELQSIMNFIYLGEATLFEDRMNEFLAVAKLLEIKQLSITAKNNTNDDDYISSEPVIFTHSSEDQNRKTSYEMNQASRDNLEQKQMLIKDLCKSKTNDNEVSPSITVTSSDEETMRPSHQNVSSLRNLQELLRINQTVKENYDRKEVVRPKLKLQCDQCDKVYTSVPGLNNHKDSVHEGVKYTCDQCDYQATQQNNLINHIKSKHEGVKFACDQCDFKSTRKDHLKAHIESKHEGVKYACDQCDFKSTYKRHLKIHIESKHEGVKYFCDQCDYQATRQGDLKTHIESKHEGVKHSCGQCDKTYTSILGLKYHRQSTHEGLKYDCDQCDYQASQQSNLRTHIRLKHECV